MNYFGKVLAGDSQMISRLSLMGWFRLNHYLCSYVHATMVANAFLPICVCIMVSNIYNMIPELLNVTGRSLQCGSYRAHMVVR